MHGGAGRLYNGDLFNKLVCRSAFDRADLTYRKRIDGMHALRHFYASVLLAQVSRSGSGPTAVDGVFPTVPPAYGLDAA
jgi:hypothetical protein